MRRRHLPAAPAPLWGAVLLLLACGLPARAEPPEGAAAGSAKRAKALVALRAEVDDLQARLRAERTAGISELRGLQARQSELSLQLDAVRVRRLAADKELAALKQKTAARRDAGQSLSRVVTRGLTRLEARVKKSLPFRLKERLAAVRKVRGELAAGRMDPESAAMKLWRLLEDELSLTSLVERAEVPLALGPKGEEDLVQVVRLGMITLFTWRPPDRYGRLERDGGGAWRHLEVTDPSQVKQVRELFRALDRQVREGLYTLPLPAPSGRKR